MNQEQLKNKIGFQIGFLIYSGKDPNDVIRDLTLIAQEYSEANNKKCQCEKIKQVSNDRIK